MTKSVGMSGFLQLKIGRELSGRFLEVGGLINFLAMLDAVDIKLGRKE